MACLKLTENPSFYFFGLGMDLPVGHLDHGMFAKPLPLASVTAHPIIWAAAGWGRLVFFGITCLGSCIMALLTSHGVPTCAPLWAWVDGLRCTWVCLSTALWASEKMSFNEVSLITQFYRQPFCSVTRLDQNPNPYPLVREMTSMPELAQRAEFCPVSHCVDAL